MRFAFIARGEGRLPGPAAVPHAAGLARGVLRLAGRARRRRGRKRTHRLGLEIAAIHAESRQRYGSPRIHAELADRGCRTSRKRVARLMRVRGLAARRRRRFRVTTQSRHPFPIAPNVLARQFERAAPDQAWVTDITYIPTGEGWLYLAVILDLCSRFAVGWAHERAHHGCTSPSTPSAWRWPAGVRRRACCIIRIAAVRVNSSGRRNTSPEGVAMTTRRRCSARAGRAKLHSPGRPSVRRHEEQRRFWVAIAAGRPSEDAAVDAGVSPAVGTRWFREAGGMAASHLRPSAPPPSGRYLAFTDREQIALWRAQGHGVRAIGRRLARAPSTISRELRRNAATRSGGLEYRATTAQWHADRAARRPKPAKLAVNANLQQYVQERLAGVVIAPSGTMVPRPVVPWTGRRHGRRQHRRWARAWSPEQIARRLLRDFPDDASMRISHEAIYQALYVQGRGALRRELTACLRTGRALRVPRARTRGRGKPFVTPELLISQRPAEATDRAVPGHWEGDLIVGLGSSAIGTLVERTTRFTLLLHLPRMAGHGSGVRVKNGPALAGHGAEAVRDAIARTIITLPAQLRRSLTWDQGAEMTQHARLRIDTGVAVYFCDPHSPWQRGTNENTNGLLRQYFPKGTDLSVHSADALAAVALALNTRPRKTLGWRTPAEALDEVLQSAHTGSVATTT